MRQSYFLISLLFPALLFAQVEQRIPFHPGINLISLNVEPGREYYRQGEDRGPDVRLLFEQLRIDSLHHRIQIAQNQRGQFYVPRLNFSNIPYWDYTMIFFVYVNEACEVRWRGEPIEADAEIPIQVCGWVVPYLPDYRLSSAAPDFDVLSPIIGNVVFAADEEGRVMLPRLGFSNMQPWQPGKAYWVKTYDRDVVLRYPEAPDEEPQDVEFTGNHWQSPGGSDKLMVVMIDSLVGISPAQGDQIAAFTLNDTLVGVGDVVDGRCGFVVWGRYTAEGWGHPGYLVHDAPFYFRYWSEERGEELYTVCETLPIHRGFTNRFYATEWAVFKLTICGIQTQTLHFNRGFNLISLNVIPPGQYWRRQEGPDVRLLFASWYEPDYGGNFAMYPPLNWMKDERGRWWAPAFEWCLIPYWNLAEGYIVNVREPADLEIAGAPIEPDADIPIQEGWNLIAYYPNYQLDASAPDFYVLSPVIDYILIAKDIRGRFMLPQYRYSNMLPWRPGQGYQVKTNAAVVLNYPAERQFVMYEPPISANHWTAPDPTLVNMSLLITEIQGMKISDSDQIAAFDAQDRLVGVGDATNGMVGLPIFGNDDENSKPKAQNLKSKAKFNANNNVDDNGNNWEFGLNDGDAFTLRYWNDEIGKEWALAIEKIIEGKGLVYETNSIVVIKARLGIEPTSTPNNLAFISLNPNPFNSVMEIVYKLSETSYVSISIYNSAGKKVSELFNEPIAAGEHSIQWTADRLTSGIYFVQLSTARTHILTKAVLIK